MLPSYLTNGSLLMLYAALLAAGMGAPVSEDAVILAGGALAERGVFEPVLAVATAIAGIVSGDFILFSVGRKLGPKALERRFFQRILPPDRRERAEAMYERHGGLAVFFSRFLIGFRIPAFATAGILGMSPLKFVLCDFAGALISAPLVFGVGYAFSNRLNEAEAGLQTAGTVIAVIVAVALVVAAAVTLYRRRRA